VSDTSMQHNIVTCRPAARERPGKQALNETSNRGHQLLGNARNTCMQQLNRCFKRCFLCGSHISLPRYRMVSALWYDPRLHNEKTTITDS
jgi:hypothetical protein